MRKFKNIENDEIFTYEELIEEYCKLVKENGQTEEYYLYTPFEKWLEECLGKNGSLKEYQFNWEGFDEFAFQKTRAKHTNALFADDYVGAVRVGNLCFDLVLRDFGLDDETLTLTYDLYVGGVDDGYAEKGGYPYAYADGGSFPSVWRALPYDKFRDMAEQTLAHYISYSDYSSHYHLAENAFAPLNIW